MLVEPTRLQNITVRCRRSRRASATGAAVGIAAGASAGAAVTGGVSTLPSLRRSVIASSSFSQCPSAVDPSSFRFSCVRVGRTVSSISFSRNAASYFPRPRLRSQTTTPVTAPLLRVAAHHRLSDPACPAQHPKQPSLLRELIHAVKATRSPLNLARCRRSLGAPLTPLQPAP